MVLRKIRGKLISVQNLLLDVTTPVYLVGSFLLLYYYKYLKPIIAEKNCITNDDIHDALLDGSYHESEQIWQFLCDNKKGANLSRSELELRLFWLCFTDILRSKATEKVVYNRILGWHNKEIESFSLYYKVY